MVWQVKQLLEENGIPCFIKNEFAIGGVGELSPLDVMPEVWLNDDEWQTRAQRLIEEMEHSRPTDGADWICNACQESNDVSFEICWQCGKEKQRDAG